MKDTFYSLLTAQEQKDVDAVLGRVVDQLYSVLATLVRRFLFDTKLSVRSSYTVFLSGIYTILLLLPVVCFILKISLFVEAFLLT